MSDLGTINTLTFSRAPGTIDLRYLNIHPLPAITASTDFDDSTGRKPGSMFPEASALNGVSTGILTSFPVVPLELRWDLGSANPQLISIAEEPLLVRSSGFTPD